MSPESILKALVLTHGVTFSDDAIRYSRTMNAKRQNLVYNAPDTSDLKCRPQELLLTASDGYAVCVSAVAPVPNRQPVHVDAGLDGLFISKHPELGSEIDSVRIEYVGEPSFYRLETQAGRPLTRIVSACGLDELNIWPWHDCAIEKPCDFCGINTTRCLSGVNSDLLYSLELRRDPDIGATWARLRNGVLQEIAEAVTIASRDQCYARHAHIIISSGNLANAQLDEQARIYADIASFLSKNVSLSKMTDGITAVTAPPRDLSLLQLMKDAGICTVVFNLEAFNPGVFETRCAGKAVIGRTHYIDALEQAVAVFGWSHAWSNFVLGLEDPRELLRNCEWLAARGVTPGANILHLDHGAKKELVPPTSTAAMWFYCQLAAIYKQYNHSPFYCARALRTSLANEAVDGRMDSVQS